MVRANSFLKRLKPTCSLGFGTELKQKHALFYTPFPLLTPSTAYQQGSDIPLSFPQLTLIEKLISEKQWFAARRASSPLIQQTLQGLHYLQTYDRFLIRGIVSAAYLGWAAYAVLHIVRPLDYRSSVVNFLHYRPLRRSIRENTKW